MTREELKAELDKTSNWYHNIELMPDLITPGRLPLDQDHVDKYRIPENMDGFRVLDVGAWDGFWTFEALRRGAKEVISIDDFSDDTGGKQTIHRDNKWRNYEFCKKHFTYTDDQCSQHELSVYDLKEDTFGRFDIIFFFGVLYNMRYPLYALDIVSSICDGAIFVESAVCDHRSAYKENAYPDTHMIMEFYPNDELSNNPSNWWAPTVACMCNMIAAAGFDKVDGWKLTNNPKRSYECRGFTRGIKKAFSKADQLRLH